MVTALPGVPIGGHIALFLGDRTTYWRMTDDVLTEHLNLGVVRRETLTDTGRRERETLLFDEASGEVRIPSRYLVDGSRSVPRTKLVPVTQQEAEAAATQEACAEAFRRLGVLADVAAGRRESFMIEPIEHRGDRAEPNCLLTVQMRDGQEVVAAVANPAPQHAPFEGRTTLAKPVSLEAVEHFGGLALEVVRGWGVHPLLTALIYEHGPVPPPAPVKEISPQDMFNSNLSGAMCGVPIANHIALQIGERMTYWKMLDNVLYGRLGRGNISRSALSDGRFREMIMIDETTGVAMIMDRFTTNGAQLGLHTQLQQVTKEEAYQVVHREAAKQAYRWVGRMIDVADGRREYLTLEPLVNQGEPVEPYVRMAIQNRDGENVVFAGCFPPASERSPFKGNQGLSATFSLDNTETIGEMAMYAMYEWEPHPLEMALTYNRYPGCRLAQGLETLTDEVRAMFAGTLTPVVAGIPIGGYVALQQGEQRSYWRMTDTALPEKLGRGLVVRAYLQDHRYRDELLFDQQSGELLIPDRFSDDGSTTGTKTTLVPVSAQEALAAATPEACREAFEWLGRVTYSASRRDELICADLLENQAQQDPYVQLAVRGPMDDENVAIFASPAPSERTRFNNKPGMEGPASPDNILGLGMLALEAVNDWGVHPLHLTVTYFRQTY